MIDGFAKQIYGITRQEALKRKICIKCKTKNLKFKDKISEKEYLLSAFCQKCQDEYFD
jgi:RNase P subunit RPR2